MSNDVISVSIYKGEERFLIIPQIRHIGGFSVESQWYKNFPLSTDFEVLGKCIEEAIKHIMDSEPSALTPIERKANATWKKGSKYKSWLSFWKNNLMVRVEYSLEAGEKFKTTWKNGICTKVKGY